MTSQITGLFSLEYSADLLILRAGLARDLNLEWFLHYKQQNENGVSEECSPKREMEE